VPKKPAEKTFPAPCFEKFAFAAIRSVVQGYKTAGGQGLRSEVPYRACSQEETAWNGGELNKFEAC